MNIKWSKNKRFKPEIILENIAATTKKNPDGSVTWDLFEHENAKTALHTMLDFPSDYSDRTISNIIHSALSKSARKGLLDKETIFTEILAAAEKETRIPEKNYRLLSTLSIATPSPVQKITIDECGIRVLQTKFFGKKYASRQVLIDDHRHLVNKDQPFYAKVIVSIKAQSSEAAFQKALRSLDLFRSFWNFLANPELAIADISWTPINLVRTGEVHTLHTRHGTPASSDINYEPNFVKKNMVYRPRNFKKTAKNIRWLQKTLDACPYDRVLKDVFIRQVRALDERDQNVAVIKLWSALEALTAPNQNNSDLIIRRCSSLYKNNMFHGQILEHLKEYRNRSVHSGTSIDEAKTHCFQINGYLRALLLFHLHNTGVFKSIDEANSFLDLPRDVERLNRQKQIIEKAILFRTPCD